MPSIKIDFEIYSDYLFTAYFAFCSKNKLITNFANEVYIEEHKEVEIGHDDDEWLTHDFSVVGEVRIGTGAIVTAGSVVTKDIEPYAIYGSVPAKFIRYRFEEEQCQKLFDSKWRNKPLKEIQKDWRDFMDIETFLAKKV